MIEKIAAARDAIGHVLGELKIGTVICVDDFYVLSSVDRSAAAIIGQFAQALALGKHKECGQLLNDPSFFDVLNDEIWKRRLREQWPELSEDERLEILDDLSGLVDTDVRIRRDKESAWLLRDLIPQEIVLKEISPAKWQDDEEVIFEETNADEVILCLFDHNLAVDPDYTGGSGIALLEKTVHRPHNREVICGLLTHTVSVGEEIRRSSKFAEEHGLKRQEFVVLSKDRLADPLRFAHGIKMMLLNYLRDLLTDRVKVLTDQASDEATRRLMELDVYDFDYMVLRSSAKEGVWEAETLFRLFEIFRRTAFREQAFAAEDREVLDRSIAQIRAVRRADTVSDPEQCPPDQRWETRRIELYDEGDFVNRAHLPLELGDLFRIGQRKVVLVAQPCDLMVRENGRRPLKNLTLLNVTDKGNDFNSFVLSYFDKDSGQNRYAKFRSCYHISADVLDLAVFDAEGKCTFDLSVSPPALLHLAWAERFRKVKKRFERHQRKLDHLLEELQVSHLDSDARDYLDQSLVAGMTGSRLPIAFEYQDGIFEFGIRRIGRYRYPGAGSLLRHFFAFLSRDAGAHDYTPPQYLADGVWKCPERASTELVGSQGGSRFHRSSCHAARRIEPRNRICFDSREAAVKDGRDPCRVCQP
jgi:hypothetical protein